MPTYSKARCRSQCIAVSSEYARVFQKVETLPKEQLITIELCDMQQF